MKKRCTYKDVPNKELEAYRRPKIKARMSNRFFKSFFTVNDVCFANSPNKVQEGTLSSTMQPMISAYQRIARQRTDWACHEGALEGSSLTKAVAMSTLAQTNPSDIAYVSVCDDSSDTDNSQEQEKQRGEQDQNVKEARANRKQRRILVPITGGISSLACLWYAMQQKDACVYLCYVSGVFGSNLAGEMRSLMQLVRYARDQNGVPFVENPNNPAGEVVYHPYTRFKVLCMPSQPYRYPESACVDRLTRDFSGPVHENPHDSRPTGACPNEQTSLKHHPLTYIMLYRVLLDAAQAWECDSIVFGEYGQARELLEATNVCFNTIMTHDLVFPFDKRTDALYALQEASVRSSQIWKSIRKQQQQQQQQKQETKEGATVPLDEDSSPATGRRRSSGGNGSRSSSAANVGNNGGVTGKKSTFDIVWTTSGPSLMPDVSHYAWTCRGASQLPDVCLQSEAARSTVQEREDERQVVQKTKENVSISQNSKKGKSPAKRKRGVSKTVVTTPLTKRFLEEFYARRGYRGTNLFNWCGNCIDCYMWRSVSWLWHRSVSISSSSNMMNAPSEYVTLLTEGYWRYLSERRLLAHVKNDNIAAGEEKYSLLEQMFCPDKRERTGVDKRHTELRLKSKKIRRTGIVGASSSLNKQAGEREEKRKTAVGEQKDVEKDEDFEDDIEEEQDEDEDEEEEEEEDIEEEDDEEDEDGDFEVSGTVAKDSKVGGNEDEEDEDDDDDDEDDEDDDDDDGNEFYNDLDDDGFAQDGGNDDYNVDGENDDDDDIDYN